jgi:GAF domain-containing protein/anti-sigma regulatory factor (Ser/Thr protein kinase)
MAILDGRIVEVRDYENDLDVPALSLAVARALGFRSNLAVPLLREGTPIGAIAVARATAGPFLDRQIELLRTFADQAVIAIENVRLFTELQARNRDLTATSEILQVISRSPTDVQPVFEAIVESAVRLSESVNGSVFRFDGQLLHLVAVYGMTPEAVAVNRRVFPRLPGRGSATARAILTRAVVHVDIAQDPEYEHRELVEAGFRSVLSVPMLREGEPVGAITVTREEGRPYTDAQIILLQTFADQAVIAIENVRLFTELQDKNQALTTAHRRVTETLGQQTATSEILQVIASSPTDAQPVFDTIVRAARQLCDAVQSNVALFDGERMHWAAGQNIGPRAMDTVRHLYPMRPDRSQAASRAVLTRGVVQIPDVLADPEYRHDLALEGGWRSLLSVPMIREGEPIGAITVARPEPGVFAETQVALLQTFAAQAVIAIENVRLFTETKEALEQQTATSEILRVIASSPTNLQPVLDAVAANAARMCGADDAAILRLDGDVLRLGASVGPIPKLTPEEGYRVTRDSLAGRAVMDQQTIHVHDMAALPDEELPFAKARHRLAGYRTAVATPLLRERQPLGAILIRRMEVRPFTEKQIQLLETFAAQAVIAIENVRLFTELQERTRELARSVEELKALGEVGQAVSSTLDLETVLTTVAARADQLSGTDGAAIYEFAEATDTFHLRVALKLEQELIGVLRARPTPLGEGVVGRVGLARAPVQIPDIVQDETYHGPLREVALRAGNRALLAVPLLREDLLVGALVVGRRAPGHFPEETVTLLQTFAAQSVLAIQNARLFREIADTSRQLEAASRHKSEFLANMSHELRTPLNAIIGFSEVLAERMFGEVNEKQGEYLQDILASGRHLLSLINDILDLSKVEAGRLELELGRFHLPTALDNALTLIRERASRHGITLDVAVDPEIGEIVADERKVKQILLNLLSNAVKFTPEGGRVGLTATAAEDVITIAVSDTGVGIAAADQATIFEEFRQVGTGSQKQEGTGLGLTLTKKFVELHGGRLWVSSEEGRGSTFTFTLPRAQGVTAS